jgi:hypothetical protein
MAENIANPLNSLEKSTLRSCEKVIERGCKTFLEVGNALAQINSESLYRESHRSFAAYCSGRWGLSKSRAYQLIEGAQIGDKVSTVVDTSYPDSCLDLQIITPTAEGQVRPLSKLPDEQRPEAWREAVAAAGGRQPTSAQVQEVVDAYLAEDEPDEAKEDAPDDEPTVEEQIDAHNKAIESFCRGLLKAAKEKPDAEWIDHKGRWDGFLRKVKQGLETLRSAKAVECPGCEGEGCKECRVLGYLPKLEAESISG